MKNTVHKLLFMYFNGWAITHAYLFKKNHPHKCHHISLNELSMYASFGLLKSIQNYKGTSNFAYYSSCYINGELYNAITELHPITDLSKKTRKKGNQSKNTTNRSQITFLRNNEWLFNTYLLDKYEKEKDTFHDRFIYQEIWNTINNLSPLDSKIISYKFNYNFEKQMSNKDIANLLNVSEESIRKKICSISKKLEYL